MPEAAAPRHLGAGPRLLPAADASDALDRVAALAARLVSAPAAQVSLLTDVRTVVGGAGAGAGNVGTSEPVEDSLCAVTVRLGAPLVLPDSRADERVNTLVPVTSGQIGAYLGVPLVADSGDVVGALCVFDPEPRGWADADVSVLQELAGFALAELEVAALGRDLDDNRARWELSAEAGDVGSFDWDLVTGELVWDDRLIAMYGYDVGDVEFDRSIASVEARVHPQDAELIGTAMGDAIAAVGPLHVVYRILRPGGELRWLEARGRALAGPEGTAVRLIGVSWDVTAEQDAEARDCSVRRRVRSSAGRCGGCSPMASTRTRPNPCTSRPTAGSLRRDGPRRSRRSTPRR